MLAWVERFLKTESEHFLIVKDSLLYCWSGLVPPFHPSHQGVTVEGKEYTVEDGDVMHFRFNV